MRTFSPPATSTAQPDRATPARLIGSGAVIKRDDKEEGVADFPQAMKWLLGEVERSAAIQRYKGSER